jgi:hypothetical protein
LEALTHYDPSRAGLRVVAAEPTEADVERVARLLCAQDDYNPDGFDGTWVLTEEKKNWRLYRDDAREAIAAFLQGGGHE